MPLGLLLSCILTVQLLATEPLPATAQTTQPEEQVSIRIDEPSVVVDGVSVPANVVVKPDG